jgi:hypothetical protein
MKRLTVSFAITAFLALGFVLLAGGPRGSGAARLLLTWLRQD